MTYALSRVLGWAAVAAIIIGALVLRVPRLDQRPMHGDEANQAVRTGLLLDQGYYHYDPADHHGPTLHFAAWLLLPGFGGHLRRDDRVELPPGAGDVQPADAVADVGTGSCANGHGLFVNRVGLYSAALLTVVSPAMVYYNRFFIQESMLITFLTGMLLCAVRYASALSVPKPETRNPKPETRNQKPETLVWAAAFGAFAGLAAATKETVVLSFAAAAVAMVAACGFGGLWRAWRTRDALVAVGVAAFVAVLLYSSFFTYPRGVYDALFSTYQTYHTRPQRCRSISTLEFYLKIIFWFKYGRGLSGARPACCCRRRWRSYCPSCRFGGTVASKETRGRQRWVRFWWSTRWP